jgi:bifunctional UDP-N-acetylglucosamine pyrophosphorylase/glucosamine-1-phosphate N-acetyltransferase
LTVKPLIRQHFDLKFVRQEPQLGTGHAVQQAVPVLPDDGMVVVLSGDVPLIGPTPCAALITACAGERLALLTVELADPGGLRAHRAQRRRGAGHRRAQGRHTRAAPDPRDLHRHHGPARRAC